MRSVAIVVIGELGQHCSQVLFVDDDQVVETLGSDRPHDSLGHRIGVSRQMQRIGSFRHDSASSIRSIR